MKLYTKGMIGKKFKINYKQIDEWMFKLRAEWGNFSKSGWIKIPDDPYYRRGLPDYVVDAYPNIHPQPLLYILQSSRPEDITFFMDRIQSRLSLDFVEFKRLRNGKYDFENIYRNIESGKSVAIHANQLIASELRNLVIEIIERGGREILVQIKGHWHPEPYNTIEFDTDGDDEVFLSLLAKKMSGVRD